MKLILAALCLFLAACADMPVIGQVKMIRAEVQVPIPCKAEAVTEPEWPLDKVSIDANEFVKGQAALVEVERRREYEAALKGAVKACQ